MKDTISWAMAILDKASKAGMYGRITFIFEAGQPVRVHTETAEQPPKAPQGSQVVDLSSKR